MLTAKIKNPAVKQNCFIKNICAMSSIIMIKQNAQMIAMIARE